MSPKLKSKGRKVKSKGFKTWKFPGNGTHIANVLYATYPVFPIDDYQCMVKDLMELMASLINNHGYTDGSKRYGVIKDYTISLIEGREPENPPWLSTSEKFGVPSKLGSQTIKLIVHYLKQSENPSTRDDRCYQAIITLLNIVRKVKGLSDPNYNSVTEKAKPISEDLLSDFETYVTEKLRPFAFDPSKPIDLSRYPVSVRKKGPNGKYKVETAHQEAIELVSSKLFRPFKGVCQELGLEYLVTYLENLAGVPLDTPLSKNVETRLRVIVPIPDSGFKTRLVAISDFWTQLVMMPVRDHIQRVIETLFGDTDFRMNQNDGVAAMKELQKICLENEIIEGHKMSILNLGFIDASTWTDRFHRDLQKIVAKALFGPRFAECWAQLVVHCNWYSPQLKTYIKYGQGQGMGTNGSFDFATLTDHLLINMIYEKTPVLYKIHKTRVPLYGKVGDDLFAYCYKLLLEVYSKINLPINVTKSKIACKLGSVGEFCSRTTINGQDVSRISPNIITKTKDFKYFPLLISLCHSRGIALDSSLFQSLNRKVKKTGETYLTMLQPYMLGLYTLEQIEPSSFVQGFNLQQMIEEGWFTDDRYINVVNDPQKLLAILFAHCYTQLANVIPGLEDKIFDLVEGMEHYGDEIIEYINTEGDIFDNDSELATYLLSGPFIGQRVLLPTQIVVLNRYRNQRSLLRDELEKLISSAPRSLEDLLPYVKGICRIIHQSCYDGGSLTYDTEKVSKIHFSITKTLQLLNDDFDVITLDDRIDRKVLQYMEYDQIIRTHGEVLPKVVTLAP